MGVAEESEEQRPRTKAGGETKMKEKGCGDYGEITAMLCLASKQRGKGKSEPGCPVGGPGRPG